MTTTMMVEASILANLTDVPTPIRYVIAAVQNDVGEDVSKRMIRAFARGLRVRVIHTTPGTPMWSLPDYSLPALERRRELDDAKVYTHIKPHLVDWLLTMNGESLATTLHVADLRGYSQSHTLRALVETGAEVTRMRRCLVVVDFSSTSTVEWPALNIPGRRHT